MAQKEHRPELFRKKGLPVLQDVGNLLGKRIRIKARGKGQEREKVVFGGLGERSSLEIASHHRGQSLGSCGEPELLLLKHVAGGGNQRRVCKKDLVDEESPDRFVGARDVVHIQAGREGLVVEGQHVGSILVLAGQDGDPGKRIGIGTAEETRNHGLVNDM